MAESQVLEPWFKTKLHLSWQGKAVKAATYHAQRRFVLEAEGAEAEQKRMVQIRHRKLLGEIE